MKPLLLGFLLLFSAQLFAEKIYQSIDKNGNVMFSDTPSQGAEAIDIEASPSSQTNALPQTQAATPGAGQIQAFQGYKRLEIVSPVLDDNSLKPRQSPSDNQASAAPGATIWSNLGQVEVSVAVEPSLQPGDTLQVLLDERVVKTSQEATHFVLTDVTPGQHRLRTQIVGADGRVLLKSKSLIIYLHRTLLQSLPKGQAQ